MTDSVSSRVPRLPWKAGAVKRARMRPRPSTAPVPICFVPDSFAVQVPFGLKPIPRSRPLPLLR